jgi:hypothetical protein
MHRLLVNPGSPQAWEIRLKPGMNSVGRGPENDFTIEHDSISTFHCRIAVKSDEIIVQDLGSTNGTFVGDRFVREGALTAGEVLQLGSIKMLLESIESETEFAAVEGDELLNPGGTSPTSRLHLEATASRGTSATSSVMTMAPAPATLEEAKTVFCKNHYQNLARYKCPHCQRYVCDLCVNTRGTAGGGQKFCKICSRETQPVIFKEVAPAVDFFEETRNAFKYPVLGDGLFLLFGGSFFFGFLDVANYVSRHGFQYGLRAMMMRVTIFTFIFGTGYLFSYLKKIIASTAAGDRNMPDWPEFSEWHGDIVAPMFQFLLLTVLCFGPALAVYVWSEGDYPWLVWLAALVGAIYFPMAFLGIAIFDSLAALNPKFVVGSILRVPREYTIAVAVFCGSIAIRQVLEFVLGKLLKIPLAPTLIADLIMIYLLMVEARILGVLYFSEQHTLGWFKRLAAMRQTLKNPRPD